MYSKDRNPAVVAALGAALEAYAKRAFGSKVLDLLPAAVLLLLLPLMPPLLLLPCVLAPWAAP